MRVTLCFSSPAVAAASGVARAVHCEVRTYLKIPALPKVRYYLVLYLTLPRLTVPAEAVLCRCPCKIEAAHAQLCVTMRWYVVAKTKKYISPLEVSMFGRGEEPRPTAANKRGCVYCLAKRSQHARVLNHVTIKKSKYPCCKVRVLY